MFFGTSNRGRNNTSAVTSPGLYSPVIAAGTAWANRLAKGTANKLRPITGQREASSADTGPATQTTVTFTAVMNKYGTAQACGSPRPSCAHMAARKA